MWKFKTDFLYFVATAADIEAPAITRSTRFGPTSAEIEVDITPSEEVELEYFEVNFYNSTGNRGLDLLVSHSYILAWIAEDCVEHGE